MMLKLCILSIVLAILAMPLQAAEWDQLSADQQRALAQYESTWPNFDAERQERLAIVAKDLLMTQSGHSSDYAVRRWVPKTRCFRTQAKRAILRYRSSSDLGGRRDLTCDNFQVFVGGKADFEHRAAAGRVGDFDYCLMGLDHPLDDG